jgi:(E)-4-hydroxy-3-methyl-but-2-enyl pyrophosphate reductase
MGTVEHVRVARRTGFCYGVREAIDHARLSAANGRATLTLGQTVHNEGVISDLQARGIRTVDTLDLVEPGTAVVIRAHGVTPDVMESAQQRGLDVIDGTCSWVVQEHREVAQLVAEGYTIVLLGTPYHPEVVGILGYAPDAIVVDEEEEWDRIPRTKRMALVSQSTQPPWKFERLAGFMVSRCHELRIVNTVCPVTIRRQEDTIELAGQVDMMVVVGGRNSANTRELTRLVGIAHKPAVQVERASELVDAGLFDGYRTVGITGGTSTPIEDLETVTRRVCELAGTLAVQERAAELARAAIAEVADPAYRSTSIGRPDRNGRPGTRPTVGAGAA